MNATDPLAPASIFLQTHEGRTVGAAPVFTPAAGAPGVLLQVEDAAARLSPEDARRLALALTHAADALRAAYHAWEQEQSGVATPPLPFEEVNS